MIDGKVTFPDISAESMALFLQHIYGISIFTEPITFDNTVELYDLSERFQYADLKKNASEHVARIRNSSSEHRAKGIMFDEKLNIKESRLPQEDLVMSVLIYLPVSAILYLLRENRIRADHIWCIIFQWIALHDAIDADIDPLLKYCSFRLSQDCIGSSYIDTFVSYAEIPSLRLTIIQGLKNNLTYNSTYNPSYYGSIKTGMTYQDVIKFKQEHTGVSS